MSKWIVNNINIIVNYLGRKIFALLKFSKGKDPLCMSKGKQPRTKVKVPKLLLSEIKKVVIWVDKEMGLEAAIIWRPRNRALVKSFMCIENLTDLNNIPKLCPHLTHKYTYIMVGNCLNILIYRLIAGVAERWVMFDFEFCKSK